MRLRVTRARVRLRVRTQPSFSLCRTRITTCYPDRALIDWPSFRTRITTCCCSLPQASLDFELLVALLLSECGAAHLAELNPCLTPRHVERVQDLTVAAMLAINRYGHVQRCEALARGVLLLLRKAQASPQAADSELSQELQLKCSTLADA